MPWYTDKFRRHLCDMHIEDWDDSFLSEFSPETYCEMLKKAHVQVAMLYWQSHVGYCNWPSKTAKVHRHFQKHPHDMKRLAELCQQNDIRVVGYYSLDFNNWAHDEHPEWRMWAECGESQTVADPTFRYGLCCPNYDEYRAFVYKQIDEMLEYFPMDAIFFDMLHWPHVCYCPACQDRYRRERKRELPHRDNCTAMEWIEFCDSRAAWMGEWAQAVTDYVKSKAPDLPVEHNFSAAASGFELCCRDGVASASDYVGGDLYGGPLEQSFVCSMYRDLSQNQPFEYMTGRCTPNLKAHTVTKTEDELTRQVLLTCAHHGAFLAIDAIDPVGTLDERFYTLLGKINKREAAYEPYLTGDLVADVGLFYNLDSAVNLQQNGEDSAGFLHFATSNSVCHNHTACIQAAKHLIRHHIPFGVTTKGKTNEWHRYRTIVAPNINRLDEDTVDALIRYVDEGGTLYFSNCDEPRLFETLIGGKAVGTTGTTKAYVFPVGGGEAWMPWYNEKYPMPLTMTLPLVEGVDPNTIRAYIKLAYTDVKNGDFSSIHSDPPGISTNYPALVEKQYGKGKVIWSAGAFEFHGARDYGNVLTSIVNALDPRPFTVTSTAARNVELISFRDGNRIRISAVDLVEDDEFFTYPDFTVTYRTQCKPTCVRRLPDGEEIPFTYEDGAVTFPVCGLRIMDMYEIEM